MGSIRRPSGLLSSPVILMSIAMDFNGSVYNNLGLVYRLGRRFNLDPWDIVAAIKGVWPSTATDTFH
jgi:hypothetical protein